MRTVRCPICRKDVALTGEYLPFCSERCKLIDLGNWASEKYVISRPLQPGEVSPKGEGEDGE
ncbi:MAG: DNA gyrase inhibitor YacG [Bryobacteraceae bacterium]|nr:DNA gyrase inhibitor YacG [Bryobacteraceae bacterium]